MAYQIEQTIATTPYWLYAFFCYLILVGFRASHPHSMYHASMVLSTLLIVTLAVFNLFYVFTLSTTVLTYFTGILLASAVFGYWQLYLMKVNYQADKKIIHFPGSYFALTVILLFIAAKFYFHIEITPYSIEWFQHSIVPVCLLALATGLNLGNALYVGRLKKISG